MGFGDIFKAGQFKSEIEQLRQRNEYLENLLTPEMQDIQKLHELLNTLNSKKTEIKDEILKLNQEVKNKRNEIYALNQVVIEKNNDIIELDDKLLLQDFGVYTPIYNLMDSESYKDRLLIVRQQQKDMIKNDVACMYPTTFTLDGSLSKGKKLVKDNVKQILRSFNNECDAVIDKVKFNNIESIRKKIQKSFDDLNKMNSAMKICILTPYLQSKLEELNLCYEYSVKRQQEKEEQKEIRERLREEAKLQREIEEERKKIEKEKQHYQNALNQLEKQILSSSDEDKFVFEQKRNEILTHLNEIQKSISDIDYREANKRAGYVYVISNIGSFGEGVYKIGMTRRLEPTERVDELGDASVPFNFDIHAMIFSDDAPSLENALHKAFENKKLNMINQRREFFKVTLDEIESEVRKNHDKTIEFKRTAAAEQYRESLMLKKRT